MKFPIRVYVIGAVSFCNDVASDMLVPILPLFLISVLGAGPAVLGLIEGVAETTASFLKFYAGRLADTGVPTKTLAVSGYAISNLARPLIALAHSWPIVLLLRFGDRIGKGLRTAPRDALLAAAVPPRLRGEAFGLHRSLDHAGATLGPVIAGGLLAYGFSTQNIILISAVPGILAVALFAFGVPPDATQPAAAKIQFAWRTLPTDVRGLVLAGAMLAFAALPDAFLILWLSQAGVAAFAIPFFWAGAGLLRTLVARPAGTLSDRIGRTPILLGGWTARVLVLAAVPFSFNLTFTLILFFAYALLTAATEGAERALIGDHTSAAVRGQAYGVYYLFSSLAALPGAVAFGAIWQFIGRDAAFLFAAAVSFVAVILLQILGRKSKSK